MTNKNINPTYFIPKESTDEFKEELIGTLAEYESIPSPKTYMNTTKLGKILASKDYPFDADSEVSIGGKTDSKIIFSLSNPNEEKRFDQVDRMIYDAVSTLVAINNEFLTIDNIYRKMHGFENKEKASNSQREDIAKRLEEMKNTLLDVDFSEHYQLNFKESELEGKIYKFKKVSLLDFVEVTARVNGNLTDGYLFKDIPILYRYASDVKHINSVDNRLLNLSHDDAKPEHRASNTNDRSAINTFILDKLHAMKQNSKLSRVITLQSIYEMLERVHQKELSEKSKKTVRGNLQKHILPQLVDKGEIKNAQLESRLGKITFKL